MSIKTSKRIALGVITALVFAPFAAIAPASAAEVPVTAIALTATPAAPAAEGTVTVAVSVTVAAMTTTDTAAIKAFILAKPAGSTAPVGATHNPAANTNNLAFASGGTSTLRSITASVAAGTSAAIATAFGSFTFVPSIAGSYTLRVFNDSANAGVLDPGEAFQDIVVTVGSVVSGLAQFGNSANVTDSANGNLNGVLVPTVSARIVEASGRVGQMVGFAPNYLIKRNKGHDGASPSLDTGAANLNYTVTNPAGTAVSVVTAKVAGVASTQQDIAGPAATITTTATTSTTRSTPVDGSTVFFNPATAGVYTITVWHDANLDNLVSVGEASASVTVTVAADGLPSITFTKYGSNPTPAQSAAAFAGAHGQLVKVSLRNGTVPFTLAANESLVLTGPTLTVFDNVSTFNNTGGTLGNGNGTGGVTQSLTAANFNGAGDAWVSVGNTTAAGGTFAITAGIQGGTASGASGSFALTVVDTASAAADGGKTLVGNATSGFTNVNTGKGVFGPTIANGDAAATYDVKRGTATTVSLSTIVGATNGALFTAVVTDTEGLITGLAGSQFNVNATTAATGTTPTTAITLSAAIPATTAGLANNTTVATMVIDKATDATVTIRSANSAISTVVVEPGSLTSAAFSIRAGVASANTFSALVLDQFGNAMATQAVTARVTAGRNLQALATPLVTGVDGRVSFTVTDTHTGTLLLTDTLTFTSGSAPDGVVTINYANYLPTATVTVTGAASEDVAPAISYNDINAGVAGASGTLVTITATLKDANGATLPAGIPVTWAISGLDGKSAIYVNPITGFNWSTTLTSATGAATTRVYAWAVGTVTVTATNNAIVGTGKINFRTVADSARVLSGSVSGNLFTAKVVDRYGNLVEGVNVTATRTTGPAVLQGTFPTSASQATIADGTVTFATTGGAGTFKLEISGGQSTSAAGKVGATTITVGSIGESLAPAGVPEVSVTVAAPVVPPVVVPPVVYDNPTLSFVKDGGRVILSGTAVDGEGDIIIYTKKVGTTAWKERAKTLEVAAPGDFNGSIKAPKSNVLIRVKQEGTGQFSNQVIVLK